MKQQGCWIEGKDRGGLAGERNQGIGDQKTAAVMIQTGNFMEGAQSKIDRSQRDPAQLIRMGQSITKKDLGAIRREAKPTGWELQRETPLSIAHPQSGPGEGTAESWHRQLVL